MSEAYCDTDSMFEGESIGEAEPSMEHRDQDKTSEIQPKTPHKRLLKDLSRSEYVQIKQQLTQGPWATILVGKEKKSYTLPKSLVCYYSSFFDRAFNNSRFHEGLEQRIHLKSCSDTTFDLCYQWLNSETMTLDNPKPPKGDKLNILIDFLMFADFIGLLGPFDSVLQEIRSLLLSRTALLPQHIRTAAQLPYGNPLRILIAEACVKPYAWSLQLGGRNGSSKRRFRFQKEMDTIDGFASNVVRAFTNSIRGNKTFIDPFTKELLDPHKSGYHSYYDRGTRISQAQLALKKSSEKKRTPKHTSRIEYSGDEDYDA